MKEMFTYAKNNQSIEMSDEVELILNSLQDGIYVTDGNGKTLWINSTYTQKTGVTKDEVIGKNVRELVKNGFFNDSITTKVIESRTPIAIIQRIKESNEVWLVKGNPVFDGNGNVVRVINIIQDVTELDKLKNKLKFKENYVFRIVSELQHLRAQILEVEGLIASSNSMKKILSIVQRLSEVDTTLIFLGESGTGKSTIAKLIHSLSQRKSNAFVQINCGALPEQLLESELFGYVKGAFTGANKEGKIGLVELANEGTIFLDEIGEMPLTLQVKILHFLQEKQFRRIGDTVDRNVNVRVIAATNKDLELMVKQGTFREDLYYRLSVVPVKIPPLRERKEDLRPLLNFYLDKLNLKYNSNKVISSEVLNILEGYAWPGNVRELENLVEQLVILSYGDTIEPEDLPAKFHTNPKEAIDLEDINDNLKHYVEKVEKELIKKVWEYTKDQSEAASHLGIHRTTFNRKAKKLGVPLV